MKVYIAGYAASRFRNKYPFLGTPTKLLADSDEDWINHISKGGMISPSIELIKTAEIMNSEFEEFHGSFISKKSGIFKTIAEKVRKNKQTLVIPLEVLLCLIRTRTYIRLREINKIINTGNYKKNLRKK